MRRKKIYCPVNSWGCPYYKNNECGMENPYEDCDDFYASYGDDSIQTKREQFLNKAV